MTNLTDSTGKLNHGEVIQRPVTAPRLQTQTTTHMYGMVPSMPQICRNFCVSACIRIGHVTNPGVYHVREYSTGSGVNSSTLYVYVCPEFGRNEVLPKKSRVRDKDGMTEFLNIQWKTSSATLKESYIVATSVEEAEALMSQSSVNWTLSQANLENYPDLIYAYFEPLWQ